MAGAEWTSADQLKAGIFSMEFYFTKFENRKPPAPVPHSVPRELLWQFLATVNLVLGVWYIYWRWTHSLNPDAMWLAVPLALAESMAFFGLILWTVNLWMVRDYEQPPPPALIRECVENPEDYPADRRISVDVFFPTYDEDPELVRLSIKDAKKITYPRDIDIRIHVLDDGGRPAMQEMANQEGVSYISRENNIGFKAGNLRNAMEKTGGDFIVICDADTRLFSTLLEHTLGYFRDPDVAWVQPPQWFFDIPAGTPLSAWLKRRLGQLGYVMGSAVERLFGPINIGEDPFVSSPQMFYDVIQRRRNWANASFCCGAGSVHRREAVTRVSLVKYWQATEEKLRDRESELDRFERANRKRMGLRETVDQDSRAVLVDAMKRDLALETEITPYKFHVSEDLYTSIVLHSDPERKWKSVLHPQVESKMLSPQDLQTWAVQRFKYAGGTLDIALHDNPIFRKGMSIPQKIMYGATFWSYLGCIWNIVFLLAPVVYLFTGVTPVVAYSMDFFKHILPFLLVNDLAFMVGTWGVAAWAGKSSFLSFFSINFRVLWTVLRNRQIKFPTTPKSRQEGNFFRLVIPQVTVIVLTLAGIFFRAGKVYLGMDDNITALLANTFWGINNIMAMTGVVLAAFWKPEDKEESK
jgi:cellulose synthase (UDP-forming)